MSGHSKWHSIKHKKGALDAKRGKVFTKHAKLITIAARDGGADPDMNPGLRSAIVNAKSDNVPNANIEKAVAKGAGGDKDGVQLAELMYEGFGPAGTAMFIQVITDNKNRSSANVRLIMQKNGGQMGSSGSVGHMFDKKGVILAKAGSMDADEAELAGIDAGAEDISVEDGMFEIITSPSDLMKVNDSLKEAGFEVEKAEFDFIGKNPVAINNLEDAKRILKLVEAIEDDEDVSNVYSNFDIPVEILEQV
jgi:YebC/PmpR family DNA-binding regulatory protein